MVESQTGPRAAVLTGSIWLARLVVAGVFVAAAVPKIEDPDLFLISISNYEVFPYWSWAFLAVVIPAMELVGTAALISGWKRRAGAILLGLLDAGFCLLILSVIIRGIDISCGCFGYSEDAPPVGWTQLWRDVALMAGIVLAGMRTQRERSHQEG